MSTFWVMFQIILVFGILGGLAFYATKAIKKVQFNKVGENGKIQLIDSISLSTETKSYLIEVEQERIFIVVGANGTEMIKMKQEGFQERLKQGLEQEVQVTPQ